MNENKLSINNDWIDPDDAPELTDAFFERADEYRMAHLLNVVVQYKLLQKHRLNCASIQTLLPLSEQWVVVGKHA